MSTQCNTYVMVGAVLPYESFEGKYDHLEPYLDNPFRGVHHHNGICVLFDGMCGKYVAVGKVVAKSGNWQGFDAPVIPKGRLRPDERKALDDVLAVGGIDPASVKPAPFVLSHYR
jgi:hypothetical protein